MRDLESNSQIIKNFAPSWFAMVMGTGIVSITSQFYSSYIPFLSLFGRLLFYFNILLFFLLLIPWSLRWVLYRKEALKDLYSPVMTHFYPTMPIAMVVIASGFMTFHREMVLVSVVFWLLGVLGIVFFSLFIPFLGFRNDTTNMDHITPGMFIPPVGLIVIPMAGMAFLPLLSGELRDLLLIFNYFGFGAGLFIYISLLAITMYRFVLHRPMPGTLAPTVWVNLGPIGGGAIALVALASGSSFITVREPFFVAALIFWSFGLWWVGMSLMMTAHYIRRLSLRYGLSWWAFTFPLGIYVAASHMLSGVFRMKVLDHIGFALYWLLIAMWLITFARTAMHARHGTVFRDPAPPGPVSAESLNNGSQ